MKLSKIKLLAVFSFAALLAACANSDPKFKYVQGNEEELYSTLKILLDNGNIDKANQYLNQLKVQYPFGVYNKEIEVLSIYASYKKGEYQLALTEVNRLLSDPNIVNNPHLDYILFIRSVILYEQSNNSIQDLVGIDRSKRGIDSLKSSLSSFSIYKQNSTSPEYIEISNKFIDYLKDTISRYEYNVAEFYYDRKNYLASIQRASIVWSNFPESYNSVKALELAIKDYSELGLTDQANELKEKLEVAKLSTTRKDNLKVPDYKDLVIPSFIKAFK